MFLYEIDCCTGHTMLLCAQGETGAVELSQIYLDNHESALQLHDNAYASKYRYHEK